MEQSDDIKIRFGRELKKYRQARHMSQMEFAGLCDINLSYYGKVELGKHNISLVNCWKISEGLGISLAELFSNLQY